VHLAVAVVSPQVLLNQLQLEKELVVVLEIRLADTLVVVAVEQHQFT
jgi:hypothetical protein